MPPVGTACPLVPVTVPVTARAALGEAAVPLMAAVRSDPRWIAVTVGVGDGSCACGAIRCRERNVIRIAVRLADCDIPALVNRPETMKLATPATACVPPWMNGSASALLVALVGTPEGKPDAVAPVPIGAATDTG